MMKLLFDICVIVFLLNAAHAESRQLGKEQTYKLYVFGDSYADTGNLPMASLSSGSRAWYQPHGISDSNHGNKPTGRFSDGMVQSDFLAMILGREESPPAATLRGRYGVDASGMNFAVGWAGVVNETNEVPKLDTQIDHFRRLEISREDLNNSVALVAISGYDYWSLPDMDADHDGFVNSIEDVTQKIADGVRQIQEVGVPKVLVNTLHPMGCTPWQTRQNSYTACHKKGNKVTVAHNEHLKEKLGQDESVLMLDLNTIILDIVRPRNGSLLSKQFYHKLTPCCESIDQSGYCGQYNETGDAQFWVCPDPDQYFYWDGFHPTQAGWKAVMELLEGTIKDFLDIAW